MKATSTVLITSRRQPVIITRQCRPGRPTQPLCRSLYQTRRLNSSLSVETNTGSSHAAPPLFGTRAKVVSTPSNTLLEKIASGITPMGEYQKLVATNHLRDDEHQTRIIQKLQDLHDKLISYNPPRIPEPSSTSSIFSRLFTKEVQTPTSPPGNAPLGLYLYGDVGTGKTMLMDLFYKTLPPSITRKRRVHFHAFMIDVHKRLHAAKIAMGYHGGDPILPVARDLANEACVLCFDEFQVTDIADAMILRRLLESLVNFGVVCVMTSNRHPDDLYKNGIQRSSFIPAIELLKSHFDVTDLDSGTDYRRIPRALSHVYYDPLTPENAQEVEKVFQSLTSRDPADPLIHNRTLNTWGRTITIPESTSKIAKFRFHDLCGQPLSAADYLEVTKNFGTIFVLDVPKMGMDSKDMTKIFVTSEVPIHRVFSDENSSSKPISDHMRSVMDDLGLSDHTVGSSSMFTGEEESPSLDKLQAAEKAAADLITAIQNSIKELPDWPVFTESESNKNVDASTKLEAKAEQVVTKIVDCKNDFVHLNVLQDVITLFEQLGKVTVDWEDAFILRAYPAHVPTCKNLRAKIDAKFKDADHRLKE
ncbi:hypothetical protein H0H93_006721 [Arthromyces matolae]|nr:hypothetical protein H0H93_006721 [Arthromyces matolae]